MKPPLSELLANMKGIRSGIYRHYKGDLYQVFETGLHEKTQEEFVAYKHLDDQGAPEGPL